MQEPKNSKPTVTPKQLQQLLSVQTNMRQGKEIKQKIILQEMLIYVFNKTKRIVRYLDYFIDFITKKTDADGNDVVQNARAPILFGIYVIVFCVFFGGIWSSVAPLDSAAVAIGTVIANTNKKLIQHQEGGIIKNIFVTQGDKVKQGDRLIELDDVKIKSQYEIVLHQYRNTLAMESRLSAERDGQEQIEFPVFLINSKNIAAVAKIMQIQENLFRARKALYQTQKESLTQQIAQLHKKIEGLEARKLSETKNLEVTTDYLESLKTLKDKGFAQKFSILEQEDKAINASSRLAISDTDIASTRLDIAKSEVAIIELQNKYIDRTLTELRSTQAEGAQLKEQFVNYSDMLKRTMIRSPVDGVINVLHHHTIGGVIAGGSPILEISPTNDSLIIEAKVLQKNIDSVHEGLIAKIRFSAFKSRTTPLFVGKVITISPDIVQDRNAAQMYGGEAFYIARIEINMEEFNKIAQAKNLALHPGMQAEVQIVTGTRTLLRYLLDPLTDTMFRAFREK